MSEKIFYTPSKATLLAPRPGATAMASATHSPSFAELLAEAEAVQDVVQVGAAAATSAHGTGTQLNNTPSNHTQGKNPLDKNTLEKDRAGPAMAGLRGRVRGALHSMAGLVMGPLPRWVVTLRDGKLRRGSARG